MNYHEPEWLTSLMDYLWSIDDLVLGFIAEWHDEIKKCSVTPQYQHGHSTRLRMSEGQFCLSPARIETRWSDVNEVLCEGIALCA
jgi:hypothetical protein